MSFSPFPITYRQLWLPETIRALYLPPFRGDGYNLDFVGAQKGTTCDGAHFTGSATSNINQGAIHAAQAKFARSMRFKPDVNYAAGSGNQYLWGKYIDVDNYIYAYLSTADGLLHLKHRSGGVDLFDISVGAGTFTAGVWYNLYSATGQAAGGGAASDGARLRLDNGVAATNADVTALPNGGDLIIGDYDDPGAGTGFIGRIEDVFDMTDDVTLVEEASLYKGAPPADAVHIYWLDEGEGVIATDRGSGAVNGTLDSSVTWAWGKVRQPVISFNGIGTCRAQSPIGLDIGGDITLVWIGKMKSTYTSMAAAAHYFAQFRVDANNGFHLFYSLTANDIRWSLWASGVNQWMGYAVRPVIDNYLILLGTLSLGGVATLYANGSYVDIRTGVGVVSRAPARAYIGNTSTTNYPDVSKPLMVALTEGVLDAKQAKTYSRWWRDRLNLPITI